MPHRVSTEEQSLALHDVIDTHGGDDVQLRVHRLDTGDAAVIASGAMTCNGILVLGNLRRIDWGSSARVRAGRTRVDIVWHGGTTAGPVAPGRRCRVCFGSFACEEAGIVCPCAAAFHVDCDRARLSCPGCGLPREAVGG